MSPTAGPPVTCADLASVVLANFVDHELVGVPHWAAVAIPGPIMMLAAGGVIENGSRTIAYLGSGVESSCRSLG